MKNAAIILALLLMVQISLAQSVTLKKPSGKLKIISVNHISIKGYSGSEIKITLKGSSEDKSEKTKGLRMINGYGKTDNTGIGLYQTTESGDLLVSSISTADDHEYLIEVPESLGIFYKHSTHHGDDVTLENLKGEIEISTNFNDLVLRNVTGPLMVSTVHGNIDVVYQNIDAKNPSSIVSVHGDVDVSIPTGAKNNVELSTSWGNIYTNMDIKVEQKEGMKELSQNHVVGKINGGGNALVIESRHGDVFLRKAN